MFYAEHGISIAQVLSDNRPAYRSQAWKEFNAGKAIAVKHTRPYRPQTIGKVERYQRTLPDEWGYGKVYACEITRRKALPAWLHAHDHHRPHTPLGGKPPLSRVTNVPGQNI